MIDRVTLTEVEDEYLDKDRVVFISIPFLELTSFEGNRASKSFIAYQEIDDLMRYEPSDDFIIAVDLAEMSDRYKRKVEVVNSPTEVINPWQKCTDDCDQWYITLEDAEDYAIIGVLTEPVVNKVSRRNIKIIKEDN